MVSAYINNSVPINVIAIPPTILEDNFSLSSIISNTAEKIMLPPDVNGYRTVAGNALAPKYCGNCQ